MTTSKAGGRSTSGRMRIGGMAQLVSNLNRWGQNIKAVTIDRGLLKCGIYLYNESQKQVPIVTGNLRASGFVVTKRGPSRKGQSFKIKMIDRLKRDHDEMLGLAQSLAAKANGVAVGYSAVYALRTHENPYAGRTHGISPSGKKYLPGRTKSGKISTRKTYSTVGKWKFLEDPMKHNQVAFLYILLKEAQGAAKGMQFKTR